MREKYERMLDLATRHRDAVMRGDLDQGEELLREQEALAQTIPAPEDLAELGPREKEEIFGLLCAIREVQEDTRRKLEEEVRARVREITAVLEEKRALTAYGNVVVQKDTNFDRRK